MDNIDPFFFLRIKNVFKGVERKRKIHINSAQTVYTYDIIGFGKIHDLHWNV